MAPKLKPASVDGRDAEAGVPWDRCFRFFHRRNAPDLFGQSNQPVVKKAKCSQTAPRSEHTVSRNDSKWAYRKIVWPVTTGSRVVSIETPEDCLAEANCHLTEILQLTALSSNSLCQPKYD